MRIIINKKILHVFKEDNKCDNNITKALINLP